MRDLLHIFFITVLLFISHALTSHYTYTIVAGMKSGNYAINFLNSRLSFWFWFVVTVSLIITVILSSIALVKNGGTLDFNSYGNYAWAWYAFVGLNLVVAIYWFGGILINIAHKDSLAQFGLAYISVMINLVCIVGIVVYNMWKLVGEMPNRYMWVTLVFFVGTIIFATLSVGQYVKIKPNL